MATVRVQFARKACFLKLSTNLGRRSLSTETSVFVHTSWLHVASNFRTLSQFCEPNDVNPLAAPFEKQMGAPSIECSLPSHPAQLNVADKEDGGWFRDGCTAAAAEKGAPSKGFGRGAWRRWVGCRRRRPASKPATTRWALSKRVTQRVFPTAHAVCATIFSLRQPESSAKIASSQHDALSRFVHLSRPGTSIGSLQCFLQVRTKRRDTQLRTQTTNLKKELKIG